MISTSALLDRLKREFGVYGDSEPFLGAFFSALLSVSVDMKNRAHVEFTPPDNQNTDIDLDTQYYAVIYKGAKYYINNGPEWNVEQKGDLFGEYQFEMRRAHSLYIADNLPEPYNFDD